MSARGRSRRISVLVDAELNATILLMNPRQLLAEALQLSAEQRGALAGQLIESLDQPIDEDVEAAWSVEIQRRLHRIDDGTAKTIPYEAAFHRLKRQLDTADGGAAHSN